MPGYARQNTLHHNVLKVTLFKQRGEAAAIQEQLQKCNSAKTQLSGTRYSIWRLSTLQTSTALTFRQRGEAVVSQEQLHQVCQLAEASWQVSQPVALQAQPDEAAQAAEVLRQRSQVVAVHVEDLVASAAGRAR
jgi:hypothetical protein